VHRRQDLRRQPPLALALVAAGALEQRDAPCRLNQPAFATVRYIIRRPH
jgi:hypothetical protein